MERTDVIILGGGLVGLALAAALDSSGLRCAVIDPADPAIRSNAGFDGRTSALSSSSKRMFDTIGISEHLPAPGCPIRAIQVADGRVAVLGHEAGQERPVPVGARRPLSRRVRERPGHDDPRAGVPLRQHQQSVEAERNKADLLEKKFQEAIRKAKETPDTGKPLRDFDLD